MLVSLAMMSVAGADEFIQETGCGALAAASAVHTADGPWSWCRSLKSVASAGRSPPKSGTATRPPIARAALTACVCPGLPGVR